jgi:hypothetical protein
MQGLLQFLYVLSVCTLDLSRIIHLIYANVVHGPHPKFLLLTLTHVNLLFFSMQKELYGLLRSLFVCVPPPF